MIRTNTTTTVTLKIINGWSRDVRDQKKPLAYLGWSPFLC